jgi:AcrR family transcriptional regulator
VAPRRYSQDARATTSAATRRRIIDAAAALYRERGVPSTSIQAIAERADVARGTVVNHFGSLELLLESVLDEAVADVRFPDARVLQGATTDEARIRQFVDGMFRFFERSAAWWSIFVADRELPPVRAREQVYLDEVARLRVATFGELADDVVVGAAVGAFVDYGPFYALLGAGLSLDQAIAVVGDALVAVIDRRKKREGATA